MTRTTGEGCELASSSLTFADCPRCGKRLLNGDFSFQKIHGLDCSDAWTMEDIKKEIEDMGALDGFLKGLKPEENDQFEVLKGHYQAKVAGLTVGLRRNSEDQQYTLELDVVEVLDGNGNPGRKLWARYPKTEEGVKRLVNDLFTAGIELDRSSEESFESSFAMTSDRLVYLRAWGWTPEEDRDGNPIAEEDRRTYQQMAVVSEKRVKKLVEKAALRPMEVPF